MMTADHWRLEKHIQPIVVRREFNEKPEDTGGMREYKVYRDTSKVFLFSNLQ